MAGDARSPARRAGDSSTAGLREHVFLAAAATGAALGGRTDEFTAAAAALDANSDALTVGHRRVYGDDAGKAFGPLWKSHIGFLVDYTTGLAAKDKAKADKAIADLVALQRPTSAPSSPPLSPALAKEP